MYVLVLHSPCFSIKLLFSCPTHNLWQWRPQTEFCPAVATMRLCEFKHCSKAKRIVRKHIILMTLHLFYLTIFSIKLMISYLVWSVVLYHCSCDSFAIIPTEQQCKKKGEKQYILMMLQFLLIIFSIKLFIVIKCESLISKTTDKVLPCFHWNYVTFILFQEQPNKIGRLTPTAPLLPAPHTL